MEILRLILFLGLVLHKVVWEVLKKGVKTTVTPKNISVSSWKRCVKFSKGIVLLFLVFQTLFLNLFPISQQSTVLRVIGTAIYFIGLALALIGRLQLGHNWANIEDSQFSPQQSLVTNGIYRYIRHPIYTGDILLLIGLELALNSWLVLGVLIPVLVVIKQAIAEETLLNQAIPAYKEYSRGTKRFLPFIV